jgi:hypothetical protein
MPGKKLADWGARSSIACKPEFIDKVATPSMREFTYQVKVLDSTARRIQLHDGKIQALLPRGSGECGGLPEVNDQVPFLWDPGP